MDVRHLSMKDIQKAILQRIRNLKQAVGITKTLGQQGATLADIPTLARKALKDPCMVTNPRIANQRDIEVIYEEAL